MNVILYIFFIYHLEIRSGISLIFIYCLYLNASHELWSHRISSALRLFYMNTIHGVWKPIVQSNFGDELFWFKLSFSGKSRSKHEFFRSFFKFRHLEANISCRSGCKSLFYPLVAERYRRKKINNQNAQIDFFCCYWYDLDSPVSRLDFEFLDALGR